MKKDNKFHWFTFTLIIYTIYRTYHFIKNKHFIKGGSGNDHDFKYDTINADRKQRDENKKLNLYRGNSNYYLHYHRPVINQCSLSEKNTNFLGFAAADKFILHFYLDDKYFCNNFFEFVTTGLSNETRVQFEGDDQSDKNRLEYVFIDFTHENTTYKIGINIEDLFRCYNSGYQDHFFLDINEIGTTNILYDIPEYEGTIYLLNQVDRYTFLNKKHLNLPPVIGNKYNNIEFKVGSNIINATDLLTPNDKYEYALPNNENTDTAQFFHYYKGNYIDLNQIYNYLNSIDNTRKEIILKEVKKDITLIGIPPLENSEPNIKHIQKYYIIDASGSRSNVKRWDDLHSGPISIDKLKPLKDLKNKIYSYVPFKRYIARIGTATGAILTGVTIHQDLANFSDVPPNYYEHITNNAHRLEAIQVYRARHGYAERAANMVSSKFISTGASGTASIGYASTSVYLAAAGTAVAVGGIVYAYKQALHSQAKSKRKKEVKKIYKENKASYSPKTKSSKISIKRKNNIVGYQKFRQQMQEKGVTNEQEIRKYFNKLEKLKPEQKRKFISSMNNRINESYIDENTRYSPLQSNTINVSMKNRNPYFMDTDEHEQTIRKRKADLLGTEGDTTDDMETETAGEIEENASPSKKLKKTVTKDSTVLDIIGLLDDHNISYPKGARKPTLVGIAESHGLF